MSDPTIVVDALAKSYRVHRRDPGLAAALRSVFRRRYEEVKAVDGISFTLAPAERVGFLGPNGAGKTTTLKMLAGLLHPSAGQARVAGFEPAKRDPEFLRQIMLVAGQKQQLLWDLPPSETFELNRAIYDVPRAQYRDALDEMVTLLELEQLISTPTRQLSMGQRMKCELAAALLHRPRVLFLDEPTIGLDVTMQATVRRFIRAYNERHQATVVLTSHDMDDVAAIAERVIVIDHGRLRFDGALPELVRRVHPDKRVELHFSEPVDAAALEALGVRIINRDPAHALLQVPAESLKSVLGAALDALPVVDLTVEAAPLEEVLADLFSQDEDAA